MTITLHQALILKGLAVLLMFAHHLFGLPTLIHPPAAYVSTVPGLPLDYMIGRYGKVCVALFLLLTGYGLAASGAVDRAATLRRVRRFFMAYWVYFALLIGIGAVFFGDVMTGRGPRFSVEPVRLVTNALALRHDYAYEWWFAEVYLLLLLLSPFLVPLGRRPGALLASCLLAFVAGAALDVAGLRLPVLTPANLLIWQLPFVFGVVLATQDLPRMRAALTPLRAAILLVAGTVAVELAAPKAMTPWLILSCPASLILLHRLIGLRRAPTAALAFIGQRALPLWLVHPFLCYYFAQPLVYAPRWAPLVFLWLLILTLAIVLPVEALRSRAFARTPLRPAG
ncbi:acyltransferase [Salipiger bermudensis]|uniref:acyltransferase family protein n=1 Tax=Salipiger bermudensis TaxID=344736 RepID=UPI001C99A5D7|nr:acyltransferase [Salipiger bermudensis]MBY6003753.1 acyltransferase [Salipiger bermudensis]